MRNITVRNYCTCPPDAKSVATFDLCIRFNDIELDICNCRIVNGKNGTFVAFPAFKKEEKWHPVIRFLFPDMKQVNEIVNKELLPYMQNVQEEPTINAIPTQIDMF